MYTPRGVPADYPSDSAAAEYPAPACSASEGPIDGVLIKLLVSDVDAVRGTINFTTAPASTYGAQIGYDDTGMHCRVDGATGLLRVYGKGAFDGGRIVVHTMVPTYVVIMSGRGRILSGPFVVKNGFHEFGLTWNTR